MKKKNKAEANSRNNCHKCVLLCCLLETLKVLFLKCWVIDNFMKSIGYKKSSKIIGRYRCKFKWNYTKLYNPSPYSKQKKIETFPCALELTYILIWPRDIMIINGEGGGGGYTNLLMHFFWYSSLICSKGNGCPWIETFKTRIAFY